MGRWTVPRDGRNGSRDDAGDEDSIDVRRGGDALFHAIDKKTGKRIGTVKLPAETNQAPMTYMHEGKQYVVLPVGHRGFPGPLVALALPDGGK